MKNMSAFQIAVIAIFAVATVAGIAVFALSKGSNNSGTSADLLIWGPISTESFDAAYKNSSLKNNKLIKVTYIKKNLSTFDADFVEAIASGAGPDIVILREDSVYKNRNKLLTVPYTSYSERTFKDTFIEQGEVFLSKEGVIALPFLVDPLVMYWNRDLFNNALVVNPPKYWDELANLIPKLTKKDANGNIMQSLMAMGEWQNVTNAKAIISMLLMQGGTPITTRDATGLVYSVLNSQMNMPVAPGEAAVNFYTQFSNPSSLNYTWNRALPSSSNFFLSGNLGTYIGFASEIFAIQQKNSNLNFDVTDVPQIRDTPKKLVFGNMFALAIVKQTKQMGGAFQAIVGLTESLAIKAMEPITNLPPVRRDLLAVKPTDPFRVVFYNSALLSHSWIDPNTVETSNILRDMIESITSGRNRTSEAINSANDQINKLFK